MALPAASMVSPKLVDPGGVEEDHPQHDVEQRDFTSQWSRTIFYLIICLAWPVIFLSSTSVAWSLPSMIKFAVLAVLLRFSLFWGQNEAASLSEATSFNPLLPPSFPLAVRNPYLSG